jgi:transcriptional regulator with XRE-family HTH domain
MSPTWDTEVTLPSTLTPEQRLAQFDEELEDLKHRFVQAIGQVESSPEVDRSFASRLQDVNDRLRNLRRDLQPDDYTKEQVNDFHNSLWEIRDLIDQDGGGQELDTSDALLLRIEGIRHIVRDALDEHVSGVHDDVGLVLEDLKEWLPNTPTRVLAELVGVDRRTITRWSKQSNPPPPKLALLARLVAILRHNWTEAGIIAWFDRPRRDLEGRKPRTVLSEAGYEDRLIAAARSGRSQYAS